MLAITVDTPLDVIDSGDNLTSLREAIATANTNGNGADTIDFDASLSGATIQLSGTELEITETLTIDASMVDQPVTIDANEQSRVLNFTAASGDLTLNSLAITGGKTTSDAIFPDTSQSGGGIRFLSNGTLTLTESTVSGSSTNGTRALGGGIFTDSGNLMLTNSIVSGNSTIGDRARGGGISSNSGTVTLTGSIVSGNMTSGSYSSGGGISSDSGAVTLTDSSISANSTLGAANADGGGISTISGSVALFHSTISENNAGVDGGGVSTSTGSVTLTDSSVTDNSSHDGGGGIFTHSGAVTLNQSNISGNNTTGNRAYGGGIYSRYGDTLITESTISDNTTTLNGGGIYTVHGYIAVVESAVFGNIAGRFGGGIHTAAITTATSSIRLDRSTVSDNHAESRGGGIWNSHGTIVVSSSTITRNSADQGGGIFIIGNSSTNEIPTIINSIVAGNTADSAVPDVRLIPNSTHAIDYSLIGDTSGSGITATSGIGNLLNFDPLLGPLADNGGPTQTHALLFGSPAIDAGNPTHLTDQRGLTRPNDFFSIQNMAGSNGSDIGAFELQTLVEDFILPSDVLVSAETASNLDLSSALLVEEDTATPIVTLTASTGVFSVPADGSTVGAGVTAILVDPQTITLTGAAADINTYLDNPSHLAYTSTTGVVGDNAASITVTLDDSLTVTTAGIINVDVLELPSLVVTTVDDVVNVFDGVTSLREAIELANATVGVNTITFDAAVFAGDVQSLIHISSELEITESVVIDATSVAEVVITADSNGNDTHFANTFITDVTASLANDPASLNDNSRVINFLAPSGDLTLRNLTITGGRTTGTAGGGGIRFGDTNFSGMLTLERTSISGNTTQDNGGGIWTSSGDITLIDSTISENSSADSGGGLWTFSGAVTLNASTVSGNITTGFSTDGGGIYANSGALSFLCSTFSGNRSTDYGGGVWASGEVMLIDTTITNNYARVAGGGIYVLNTFTNPLLTVFNSIIAGNTTTFSAPDLRPDSGSPRIIDYSLIGDTSGSGISSSTGMGNLLNVAPLLGPLADNGGPTQTHALLFGSPAIDAGNSMHLTDQRGFTRPIDFFSIQNMAGSNGSDIGAFELQTLVEDFILPTDVIVLAETASNLDLSSALLIEEDTATPIVTLTASTGIFSVPGDGSTVGAGVTAILVDPQTITLTGAAADINTYLDNPSNLVYTSATGVVGDNAATITVTLDDSLTVTTAGTINVDVPELPSLVVTTVDDVVNPLDTETSLREAITFANDQINDDTITFDTSLSGTVIQLSGTELEITETLTIDASALNHSVTINANQQSRVINFSATSGDLTLRSLTITGGHATGSDANGGGIRFGANSTSTLVLEKSTVNGNASEANGGGIYTGSGAVKLINSTVSGNTTPDSFAAGGGIFTDSGEVMLVNSTVTSNHSSRGGGVYADFFNRAITIRNSIIAGNTTVFTAPDLRTSFLTTLTLNYSLIGNTTGSGITAVTGIGNLFNVDPLLGPLVHNGGSTHTHSLLPGSPALNSGDPSIPFVATENDQRGVGYSRVAFDRIDMGAYEAHSTPSADFDNDGDVDGADFLAWQRGFGVENAVRSDGNSDDDTDTDASDLAAWQVSFGQPQAQQQLAAISDHLSIIDSEQILASTITSPQIVVASSKNAELELIDAAIAWELVSRTTEKADSQIARSTLLEAVFAEYDEAAELLPTANIATEDFSPSTTEADKDTPSSDPWLDDELLELVFG